MRSDTFSSVPDAPTPSTIRLVPHSAFPLRCDDRHIRRASVHDLRYSFKYIEAQLAAGQPIEIVKRNKVIARLVPVEPEAPPEWPDFEARLKEIWGDRVMDVSAADVIREDRDRF